MCRSTASASARLILSSAAASREDPTGSPFSRPQSSSGMLRCEPVAVPGQSSSTGIQDNPQRDPVVRSLLCEGGFSPLCSPSARLLGPGASSMRVSPFRPGCQMHCHCHPGTTERRTSILSASHLSDSGILLMFAARVLIASPCSVTTTASDDRVQHSNEYSRMQSRFPFSPSCWLGRHVQNLLSEFQNKGVIPSAMQPLKRRLPVATDIALLHQASSKFHQPTQYPLTLFAMRCSSAAFSVLT